MAAEIMIIKSYLCWKSAYVIWNTFVLYIELIDTMYFNTVNNK